MNYLEINKIFDEKEIFYSLFEKYNSDNEMK